MVRTVCSCGRKKKRTFLPKKPAVRFATSSCVIFGSQKERFLQISFLFTENENKETAFHPDGWQRNIVQPQGGSHFFLFPS
jgi:hypothetical protein